MYANFGRGKDFKALEKAGIDVAGKVVIMRYGPTSRGTKVKTPSSLLALLHFE